MPSFGRFQAPLERPIPGRRPSRSRAAEPTSDVVDICFKIRWLWPIHFDRPSSFPASDCVRPSKYHTYHFLRQQKNRPNPYFFPRDRGNPSNLQIELGERGASEGERDGRENGFPIFVENSPFIAQNGGERRNNDKYFHYIFQMFLLTSCEIIWYGTRNGHFASPGKSGGASFSKPVA